MAVQIEVCRNAGHPWDGRNGFDLMWIRGTGDAELQSVVTAAERKFWQQWLVGTCDATGNPAGLLYKPCAIRQAWHDTPERPHPGCQGAT